MKSDQTKKTMPILQMIRRLCLLGLMLVYLPAAASMSAHAASTQSELQTYFTSTAGLKPAAACGILANISAESGFNASIGSLSGAYGLCQWGGVRLTRLRTYCASHGYSYSTVTGQMHFIIYELQTYYPQVYNYLKSVANTAQGAYNAAYYFCAYYEVPANRFATAAYRGSLAKSTYWPLYGSSSAYLTVQAQTSGIRLSWSGLSTGKIRVMRSLKQNGSYTMVAELPKGTKSYVDKTAVKGSTNYYYVVSVGSSGKELKRSNKASALRKRSLSDEELSVTLAYETVKYNGKERKPSVTALYGTTRLKANRDYKVTYKDNKNVGTASVVLTGAGSYTGSITKEFTIVRIPWKIKAADQTVSLSKKTLTPVISVTALAKAQYAKRIKLTSSDSSVAKVSGLKLKLRKSGTVTITVTVQGNTNHEKTKKSFQLTVEE